MSTPAEVFDLERAGDTLVVTPWADLHEMDYAWIEEESVAILERVGDGLARNVILDFHRADCSRSTTLGFFVKLWKRIRVGGGHMAVCNLSEHERELLSITRLNRLWPVCGSRDEALAAVRGLAPTVGYP